MRPMPYAAVAVLMAALACSPRDRQETANRTDSAAEDVRDAAREGVDDAKDAARDARDEARDYAYSERNDFRRDVDLRLKGLDQEIAQLQRDTKRGVDTARDTALIHIRAARKTVDRDLQRLAAATESNWDELKSNVNRSVTALQDAVRRQRPDAKPMGGTGPS
jgi:hypothetical protein